MGCLVQKKAKFIRTATPKFPQNRNFLRMYMQLKRIQHTMHNVLNILYIPEDEVDPCPPPEPAACPRSSWAQPPANKAFNPFLHVGASVSPLSIFLSPAGFVVFEKIGERGILL